MHSTKQDEAEIKRLDKKWGDDATARKLDDVVNTYAEDGTLVWPDQPAVHGSAGIRRAWEGIYKSYPKLFLDFEAKLITFSEAGDLAGDFGVVAFGQDGPDGPKVIAKYVVVWKKVNGSWKVMFDSWNYNEQQKSS